MSAPTPPAEPQTDLAQREKYEFIAEFPGTPFPSWLLDEPPPVGGGRGPNPVRTLAVAVGHCMSSTFFSTLERARVAVGPMRTRVAAVVGRNAKGRQRVLRLDVVIEAAPLEAADRDRFDRSAAIFEDFCTVSGAVREGIRITSTVRPGPGPR